tara:strand:- start:3 stop:236 length:234 start_codon:yes stop_codon:yes gene_type:complete
MSKNEKNLITVNDIEYNVDDFTDAQKTMLNHVSDLDRKLGSAQFNLDQLNVGREAFVGMLANSLENPEEVEEAEVVN